MKSQIAKVLSALVLVTAAPHAQAQDSEMTNQTASYITMPAADEQTQAFAEFLAGAAPQIKETEPGAVLWFALQAQDTLAVFDVFFDEAARDAHFSGVVAGALKDNAEVLVDGGWDAGVVSNISNSVVLSVRAPTDLYRATTATYIKLEAAPGQSDALRALLTAAGPTVADTEPETLFWAALQIDGNNFAIFDVFADGSGRDAHFEGQVAGLLKEKSSELVAGGWNQGVVANVRNYDIIAMK